MKKINWFDHLIGLVVVILGISIAFYLESTQEEKMMAKQEVKYLDSFIEDLETDLEYLDTLRNINEFVLNSLVQLSNATVGMPYSSDSLRNHVLRIGYNPKFSPQAVTYESLKFSGNIVFISDFDLRTQVVQLYEQYYAGTKIYDDVIDENLTNFYQPFFMQNIVFVGQDKIKEDFLSKPEFRNIIFGYRHMFSNKIDFYETVRFELQEVIKQLKEYKETN